MKKNILNYVTLALFILISACNEEGATPVEQPSELDDATAEAYTDYAEDDVNEIVIDLLDELRFDSPNGEANDGRSRFRPFAGKVSCANIDLDIGAGELVIDFGEGCESADGIFRSGKILIFFTDFRHVSGAQITTTFDNYFVDGKQLEGTRVLTNISDETEGQRAFEVVITDGKITFEDGTFRTYGGNRTKVWDMEETSREVQLTVTGSISGVNRNGVEFSKTITEPVIFLHSCRRVGVKVAVSGERTITKNGLTYVINYGNGVCDNLVTLTLPSGEIKEIIVQKRRG